MNNDQFIPAPDPLMRRLALPKGRAEVASLRVKVPFVVDEARLSEIAQKVIGQIPSLRLHIVTKPGTSAPLIGLGEAPEVKVVRDGYYSQPSPQASTANLVELRIGSHSSGETTLALTLPAYCADRRSLEIVLKRIVEAFESNSSHGLDEPGEPSYLEVADWINTLVQGIEGSQGRLYWRRTMRAHNVGRSLETGNISAEVCFPFRMSEALTRVSLFDREAWTALAWLHVARVMTGNASLSLGCFSDGRQDEALRETIGPLSRLVPIRAPKRGAQVAEAVKLTVKALSEGRNWQELFLIEDLFEDAESDRTASFPFGFEYCREAEAALPVDYCDADCESYGVFLRCEEFGEGSLRLHLRARDGTSKQQLATLGERWMNVLEQSLKAPDRTFDDIDALTTTEHQKVPLRGPVTNQAQRTVHDTLRQACHQHRDRIAVSGSGHEVSFGQLESLATGLAGLLPRPEGEAVIAIQADRSPHLIIALFAILKSGSAFLPVSIHAPEAYCRRLLQISGAKVLITDQVSKYAGDLGCEVLDLQAAIASLRSAPPRVCTPTRVHPDQLAYVMFTSGSTAEAQAAAISHRAMLNLWSGLAAAIPEFDEPRRVGMNGPISFDTSIKQLVQLLNGHTLVLIPESLRIEPAGLQAYFSDEEIEVVDFTPSHAELVMRSAPRHVSNLPEVILLGGEAPRSQLCESLRGRTTYNLYGLTECAVDTLVGRIHAGSAVGTLGPPLQNTEVFVADTQLRPVPPDVSGELMIAGLGLARGYLGAPGRTAERFIPNPFGNGSRIFRTGDATTWNQSGSSLCHQGRSGRLVKIRGHRVSLAEVQAAIEAQAAVQAAVVACRRTARDVEALVAWVVPSSPYSPVVQGCSRYAVQGLSVAGLNRHETSFLHGEVFERNAYLRHGVFLPEAPCVFDVGANIGLFALRAHLSSPGARIFAFEPNPEAYRCLVANAEIFGMQAELLPVALGSRRGSAQFSCYRGFSLLSGFHTDREADLEVVREYIRRHQPEQTREAEKLMEELLSDRFDAHHFTTDIRTVSDVIRQYQLTQIDLLKINVEKSETEVLEGVEPGDWSAIRQVSMEIHDQDGRFEEILALLRRYGFGVTVEKDWSLPGAGSINYYVYASRDKHEQASLVTTPRFDGLPTPLTEASLKRKLATELPDFQVPARILVLDRMPLTDNGKVDQRALDALLAQGHSTDERVEPRTELEAKLLAEWSQILDRADLNVESHFFDAGGDSFSIMQFNLRLRHEFGFDLPVVEMFKYPSVRLLSQHVEHLQQSTR